jgi:hypothetical protein
MAPVCSFPWPSTRAAEPSRQEKSVIKMMTMMGKNTTMKKRHDDDDTDDLVQTKLTVLVMLHDVLQ